MLIEGRKFPMSYLVSKRIFNCLIPPSSPNEMHTVAKNVTVNKELVNNIRRNLTQMTQIKVLYNNVSTKTQSLKYKNKRLKYKINL